MEYHLSQYIISSPYLQKMQKMKSTSSVVPAIPFHSSGQASARDTLSVAEIEQVKAVLQNKKTMRRAALSYRDPYPECTIL